MADGTALDPIAQLRLRFLGSLRRKHSEVEDLICEFSAGTGTPEMVHRLFYLSHNIVGVAPTHGFHELARVAQATEAMLADVVLRNLPLADEMEMLLLADELADEMCACFGDE
ncbi:hypothetical protein [Shimia biformata]|uniref:hypothetical protein n=1 Tax=Shimia biformata TaxID=1294299 RepID=UPI00195251C0|nr:hypothetical protein [Shimia biformata]